MTWVGHACLLMQREGVNLLVDPSCSPRCSPARFAGHQRFTPPACELEDLPPIHAVLLSHSHYDHMDIDSIGRLQAKSEADRAAAAVASGARVAASTADDPCGVAVPFAADSAPPVPRRAEPLPAPFQAHPLHPPPGHPHPPHPNPERPP